MISTRALIFCSEIVVFVPTTVTLYSLVCFCKNCFGNAHQSMADGPSRGEAKRKKMAFGFHSLFSYSRGSDFCHGPILPMASDLGEIEPASRMLLQWQANVSFD